MHLGSKIVPCLVLALLALAGCGPGKRVAPSIGEAFVGPPTLKIRSDIPMQSPPVATVKHGDRLEILGRRRRFLKVRTPGGAEGWTDERQMLSGDEMTFLKELAQRAAALPVQGRAISYAELNVHTQPNRGAPSFLQIKPKEKVDVLTHVTTPRTDLPRKPLIPPPPKKSKTPARKSSGKPPKYPPPAMPKPPELPRDWLELSKTALSDDDIPSEEEPPPAKPIPTDHWSLIRTPGGQSGWVLTRRLMMAIPDEVAQYAEGHRIVSYFSLGKVDDEGVKKDIWLWTTISAGAPYDFESFRVFIWSLRRHRYETAYIERNLKGYAPVLLQDVDFSTPGRTRGDATTAKYPGFSICVEKADGQRYRRQYALLSNIVRYAGERPCEAAPAIPDYLQTVKAPAAEAPEPAPAKAESLKERLKRRIHSWFHRGSGG